MADATKSFLGTGWSFPPTFLRRLPGGAGVVMVSDDVDIKESLRILLSTGLGERIMVPDFGCNLWRQVFQSMTTTLQTEIAGLVRQAILDWEPRIDVLDVQVLPEAGIDGRLLISIDYVIRRTNARSNVVYPFYLQEGTLVPAAA
jgi:phage baseplate assembly protein W